MAQHVSLFCGVLAVCLSAAIASAEVPLPSRFVLDMVHYNPGEPRYPTAYADPAVSAAMGYNGKVFFLFDSPLLAVDWNGVEPGVLPEGSKDKAWVDAAARRVRSAEAAAKAAGLRVYAMSDLVLLPKRLVERRHLEKTFGNPRDPQTAELLRQQMGLVFDQFPDTDGLVVRIGETYLQDAPFHRGHIDRPQDVDATVIPLARLLREEVCVKRHKTLVFRTWLSFDTKLADYQKVSDAVEPEEHLVFSVKHCEGDFFRGHPFSKVIGAGRHPQLIEVQCAREYEGKGSYPNYIANGVIDGFEEHRSQMRPEQLQSIGAFARDDPKYAGIWTWTRGGGWGGPYLKNELWCDLNAWVMAQWARDVRQSEASVFDRYARERLRLSGDDVARFRKLALLSADAVVRGRTTTMSDIDASWSRDDKFMKPHLPTDPVKRQRTLDQKDEAVAIWRQIVELAKRIHFADARTADYAVVSCEYGLHLYRTTAAGFHLAAGEDRQHWLAEYDAAWRDYRALPATSNQCATLYRPDAMTFLGNPSFQTFTDALRPTSRPATTGP